MLMSNPALLRNLVDQYETLAALHAENGAAEARQRMHDVSSTLCVSMDAQDVDSALVAARRRLSRAGRVNAVPRAE
ncbi:DUF5133 domain-containing protein [Streptomyces sp. NPDC058145]|uniref:DUF5133 domain-containing protein n=1 Tax=Streptomyces sp. NPDC058145 TaxID=3346356 RepID=UPI0036F10659